MSWTRGQTSACKWLPERGGRDPVDNRDLRRRSRTGIAWTWCTRGCTATGLEPRAEARIEGGGRLEESKWWQRRFWFGINGFFGIFVFGIGSGFVFPCSDRLGRVGVMGNATHCTWWIGHVGCWSALHVHA